MEKVVKLRNKIHSFVKKTQIKNLPLSDELLYGYDENDTCYVNIKLKHIIDIEDETLKVLNNPPDIKITRKQVDKIFKEGAICINVDGLSPVEGLTGIESHWVFLQRVASPNKKEAKEFLNFAKKRNWTNTVPKPEELL